MLNPVAKMKMPISPVHISNKGHRKNGFSLIEVVVALAILAFAFLTLMQTAMAVVSSSQYSKGREMVFLQARTAAADHFSGIAESMVSPVPERYDFSSEEIAEKEGDVERQWTQYVFSDPARGMPIVSFALQVVER